MADTYFAAESSSRIGSALQKRLDRLATSNSTHSDNRGLYANAWEHYYGEEAGAGITTGITRSGEQGEFAAIRVNRARALNKAFTALVTSAKVTWRPQAKNGDSGAAKATTLAANLLEDAWKSKQLGRFYAQWVEGANAFSQFFAFPEWDKGVGPPLLALENKLVLQGDITDNLIPPWDVFVDQSLPNWGQSDWMFVRLYRNRYTLAKLHTALVEDQASRRSPEQVEDAILNARGSVSADQLITYDGEHSDLVPVWYFFHRPTPALPAGRETVFLSSNVVLADGRLSYSQIPVIRLAADEKFGTPNAWSSFWDTLGPQELLDGIDTTLASIITTLGNTCVGLEQGSQNKPDMLAMGIRAWEYPRGGKAPAAIQLAQFPPDALKYKEMVAGEQQQLMGLNDVALGQPQGAQMNAQAFAVLASMAVQQASPFQSAAIAALQEYGLCRLKTMAKRVTKERVLRITGQQNRHLYSEKQWVGADLEPVESVIVDIGNPLEQTAQGRFALLQTYMQIPNAIRTPEEVQQVIETGRIESATRAQRDELLLIRAEYEMLQNGEEPPVHTYQNHPLHYRENAAVLHNAEALTNPAVVQAAQSHCDRHYLEYFGVPPEMDPMRLPRQRFLLGLGPEPMPTAPPGPQDMAGPPMPGEASGTAPPEPGSMSVAPDAGPMQDMPMGPGMPPNPLTGQPFDNASGGGLVQQ